MYKRKSDMNCNPIKVIDSFKQYVQTLIDEEKSDTKYDSAKVVKKLENIIKEVNKVKEEYKEISEQRLSISIKISQIFSKKIGLEASFSNNSFKIKENKEYMNNFYLNHKMYSKLEHNVNDKMNIV